MLAFSIIIFVKSFTDWDMGKIWNYLLGIIMFLVILLLLHLIYVRYHYYMNITAKHVPVVSFDDETFTFVNFKNCEQITCKWEEIEDFKMLSGNAGAFIVVQMKDKKYNSKFHLLSKHPYFKADHLDHFYISLYKFIKSMHKGTTSEDMFYTLVRKDK